MALKFQLVKGINPQNPKGEKLWYGTVKHEEPVMELDDLAKHMSEHNSPYSKGVVYGILTDMVSCIKEKALEGFKIKIKDLAIFALKVKSKGEVDAKEWTVQKDIKNVHLSARATGEFSIDSLKGATLIESSDYKSPRRDETVTEEPGSDPGAGGDSGSMQD